MSQKEERRLSGHVTFLCPDGREEKIITHMIVLEDGRKFPVCFDCAEKIKNALEENEKERVKNR